MSSEPDKPDGRGNKVRKADLVRRTGLCPFCPYHRGENRGRQAKPDKGKNKRRAKG